MKDIPSHSLFEKKIKCLPLPILNEPCLGDVVNYNHPICFTAHRNEWIIMTSIASKFFAHFSFQKHDWYSSRTLI